MSGIDGISGFGGGVSVIKVRSSQPKSTAEAPRLVGRFQGQKVVESLTSGLNFTEVDDQAPHESLLVRYGRPLPLSLDSAHQNLDLQGLLNPFSNLPQAQSTHHLANLKEAKFDFSSGLDRFDAEQVADLTNESNTVSDLQKELGISSEEVVQAQEALRLLGFDATLHKFLALDKNFFALGKPVKAEQSNSDQFNGLLKANTFSLSPEELKALIDLLASDKFSISDRNLSKLMSDEQPMYRIAADDLGLLHDRPMLVAPYGITPARQKSGEMIYRAPLLGNQGLQGQLSPERMIALGVYASWRWLSTWTKERFGEHAVDLFAMEIEVIPIAEIQSDFSAVSQQPSMQRVEEMLRHMRNFGKDTLKMDTIIYDSNGNIVAIVRTKYGVFFGKKRKRRVLRDASLS